MEKQIKIDSPSLTPNICKLPDVLKNTLASFYKRSPQFSS